MKPETLYMETTKIPPERTASQIINLLVEVGAFRVAMDYSEGRICGLHWSMRIGAQIASFSMPARVDPLCKILMQRERDQIRRRSTASVNSEIRAKAERVGWRQLLRWVQAQVAMIQTAMVTPDEVFLPYMEKEGKTVYALFQEHWAKALPAPEQATDAVGKVVEMKQ